MLIALIAAGLTLAVAGPALMDAVIDANADDEEEGDESIGKSDVGTSDAEPDLLAPTDGDAPDVIPENDSEAGVIAPLDPDAPDVPPPDSEDDGRALAPTRGDALDEIAASGLMPAIEATEWRVPIARDLEPARVQGFKPGADILVLTLAEGTPGSLDVTSEGDANGLVLLNGAPLLVLEGAATATLSDIRLVGEDDALSRALR